MRGAASPPVRGTERADSREPKREKKEGGQALGEGLRTLNEEEQVSSYRA